MQYNAPSPELEITQIRYVRNIPEKSISALFFTFFSFLCLKSTHSDSVHCEKGTKLKDKSTFTSAILKFARTVSRFSVP
jgi:hypothetical protein